MHKKTQWLLIFTIILLTITQDLDGLFASSVDKSLSVERLHASPSLSGSTIAAPSISPDGRWVTLLEGRSDDLRQQDLWAYDLSNGEKTLLVSSTELVGEVELSEEEKNRRERQRIYANGIVSYMWDSQGESILFPLGGDIFTYELKKKKATQVTQTEAFETDPKVSPKGAYVSFIRNNELYVFDRKKNKERQVTHGASDVIRNGISEFVAQEELNRDTGYWWSPNDTKIAFLQIDESPVKIAERINISKDSATIIKQRYPFAGTDNVLVKVGITTPKGNKSKWVNLGDDKDIYVADVNWSKDSKTLYITRLHRDQKQLDLLKVDATSGSTKVILKEKSDTWINLNKDFRSLDDGSFIWGSERNGFHHLYYYNADGELIKPLTKGKGLVNQLSCFNSKSKNLYYSGWTQSALERHIYKLNIESNKLNVLTQAEGRHSARFSNDCKNYIGSFSHTSQPLQMGVYNNTGERLQWLNENVIDKDHPYYEFINSHEKSEFGQLKSKDGKILDYRLLKPNDLKPGEKRPAIIYVYGGPHAQTVHKGWNRHFLQLLVDQGYVVFQLDNRGAANRGHEFEAPLYRKMGQPEVEDQAIGARWLANLDFVDSNKIGVYGWSYGGYMTLMMLGQNPELYAAGVSGAPVTDWSLYDTAYTERYMGHPLKDKEAYAASSVFPYLDNIKDNKLLLIHGMADDNVIFLNTVKAMDELQNSGKHFELMTYPGEKHGFRKKENRIHRDKLIIDFFARKLK